MADAETITRALRGKWYGGYGVAFCPAHPNKRTPALRLRDGNERRLLAICGAGCGFAEIASALRGLGLLDGDGRSFALDPAMVAQRRAEEERDRRKRTAQALRQWEEAGPIGGTLAERYLRSRAIAGALPASLRFAPEAWHGDTARRLPAMVAAVAIAGDLVGVHRTYLAEPGRKADVKPAKAMLGPVGGGAVRLSESAGPLIVAEGIETGLSLLDGLHLRLPSVWAALSTSGVAGLALPDQPGELAIAPDGDDPGRKAAEALARRAHASGWRVSIIAAPGVGLDWNDAATGRAA